MKSSKCLFAGIAFGFLALFHCQGEAIPSHDIGLFDSDETLHLTMTTDMVALLGDRSDDASYHEGRIGILEENTSMDLSVKIKVRGNFRRDTNHCDFPPLRIKFQKNHNPGELFSRHHKVKLVTHCSKELYILKEYMIYKTYNVLTEVSFRVRLAKITYVDSKGVMETVTRYAFFIEDDKGMAERNGAKVVKDKRIHSDEIQRESLTRLYLFQYMIGNRDWDIYLKKNVRVIQRKEDEAYFAIPYDFDWTGTVEAPYTKIEAYTGQGFSLRKFRQLCRSQKEFDAVFAFFWEKKDEIYHIYNSFPLLNKKHGGKCIRYFDEFYKIIDNPKLVKREFLDACKSK